MEPLWMLWLQILVAFAFPDFEPDWEPPEQSAAMADFVRAKPSCPKGVETCVGLVVYVARDENGKRLASGKWFAERVREADRLFAPISVGFRVLYAETIGSEWKTIDTRKQRDEVGRDRFGRGVAQIYITSRLSDVDVAGEEIRGVHWRDRQEVKRRWIILSTIGSPLVLAHELGHFFGLPHSTYNESIMNKTPRDDPPWEERVFAKPERRRMARKRDEMLATGMLGFTPEAR